MSEIWQRCPRCDSGRVKVEGSAGGMGGLMQFFMKGTGLTTFMVTFIMITFIIFILTLNIEQSMIIGLIFATGVTYFVVRQFKLFSNKAKGHILFCKDCELRFRK